MDTSLTQPQMDLVHQQLSVLSFGAVDIMLQEELFDKLAKSVVHKTSLRMKLGMDPSSPDVHLGHTVVLRKIRQMQDFGHICDLVIGDFTGRIGDPTGKSETRKQLTEDEVNANAQTYVEQVTKVLDPSKTNIVHNATWLSALKFSDVIRLASTMTVARMLERDDFSKRFRDNRPIHVHEFFYPLMQGFDSVHLQTDIEFGGTDQTFNLLVGRALQREFGVPQQVVVTMPLLEGIDGHQKMSKSLRNYIGVNDSPRDMYGKLMSVPDHLMEKYIQLLLGDVLGEDDNLLHRVQTGAIHPRDAKMRMAKAIVTRFSSATKADQVEREWIAVFQQGGVPEHIPTEQITPGTRWIVEVLVEFGLVGSRNEARRLIMQGGVQVDGQKLTDPTQHVSLEDGTLIQVGKRGFRRCRV